MKDFPHDAIVAAALGVFDAAQGKAPHIPDVPDAPGGAVVVSLKEWRKEREKR
jgi:hypothetical protein